MLLGVLATALACIDPAALGAVPDDGRDDTPAFQQAIDQAIATHAEVCIGAGVWHLARPPGRPGSLVVTGGPLTLRGAGPSTVLRMLGRGHKRDWRALYVKAAHDVVIRDLTIDGLDATDSEEQTHLIELAPGTERVVIANATLGPMRRPDQAVGEGIGGDCLRLLGEPGQEVADVTVADVQFVDCDRSGLSFQRALRDITVVRTTITGTGDSGVDFEPTGRGAITDVTFVDVTIEQPPDAQSSWAMTVAGVGADLASRVLIERATLDGGIGMLNVANIEIADSSITGHLKAGATPTISVFRRGTDVRILRNTIARPAGSHPGFVIRSAQNNGVTPRGLTIEDNTLVQTTPSAVIGALSTSEVAVRRNAVDYTGGDLGSPVVLVSAETADVADVTVEDNNIRGDASALVIASLRTSTRLSGLSVRGNRSDNLAALRCNGPSASFAPVQLDEPLPENTGCRSVPVQITPRRPR